MSKKNTFCVNDVHPAVEPSDEQHWDTAFRPLRSDVAGVADAVYSEAHKPNAILVFGFGGVVDYVFIEKVSDTYKWRDSDGVEVRFNLAGHCSKRDMYVFEEDC